jgi:hypothetical protein
MRGGVMRRNDLMPHKPRDNYELPLELKARLFMDESKEEIDAYFEHIYHCIGQEVCADCGHAIDTESEEYRAEHIKEYSISGLCKKCQVLAFGE